MALPVAGGNEYPPFRPSDGPSAYPVKRRTADADDDEYHYDQTQHKRVKYAQNHPFAGSVAFRAVQEPLLSYPPPLHHPHPHHRYPSPIPRFGSPDSVAAPPMERTDSGHSIHPDPSEGCSSTELLEDREAAQRVRDHLATFRRRNPDSKHERILRSIINPRPRRHHRHHHRHQHQHRPHPDDDQDEYPLDNEALESIFSATNEIFFNGRLSQRVAWDWSHTSSARYDSRVIGTTALRRAAASTRGFETLIVLSATILRDAKYSRRLLISTFLHELIHCYLFICCGFRARCCGGHTDGFKDIAVVIDEWVGEGGGLYLSRVEADLELFRVGGCGQDVGEARERRPISVYPCSGMAAEQEEYAAAAAAAAAATVAAPAAQEVVYFAGGGAQSPESAAMRSQELVYVGRGVSPIPRAGTPTREVVHYYDDRAAGGGSSDNARWRQRRAVRPIYVYTGDDPTASYVFFNNTSQRP